MTPIKWLIIGWLIQTILLLVLIADLHHRITHFRRLFAALTAILKVDLSDILNLVDKMDAEGNVE